MELFMTSTPGGYGQENGRPIALPFSNDNGFAHMLKSALGQEINCLMIASSPDEPHENDFVMDLTAQSLELTGIKAASCCILDRRNQQQLPQLLENADLVILCGGHVPTQNRFFAEIDLAEKLKAFDGVVVGISAGSMNSAELTYAQPELEGEALDPDYQRWIPGLGLAKTAILPHFQNLREGTLDGLRILEDISLPDSKVHPFLAIPDGSFIHCHEGHETLYGEGYLMKDGIMTQICSHGEKYEVI